MAEYKGSVGVGGGLTQLGGGKFAIANAPDIQVDDNGKRLNEWISETTENLREKANSELVEEIKKNVEEKASKEEVEEIKNNLEEQIDEKAPKTAISSPYNFKGSCLFSELPTSGNEVNDTYYCTDVKTKYTWNGTGWYQSSLDESDYQDELSRVKTIAVSEEEPTNENVVAYINPKRGNPISVVTAEDIAHELGDSEEKVVSQKTATELALKTEHSIVNYGDNLFDVNSNKNLPTTMVNHIGYSEQISCMVTHPILMVGGMSYKWKHYTGLGANVCVGVCDINGNYVGYEQGESNGDYLIFTPSKTGYFRVNTKNNAFNGEFMVFLAEKNLESFIPFAKELDSSIDIPSETRLKYLPFYGKNIVNFGDSIFGNYQYPVDISTFIAEKTGATVYNCGFGGCRMGRHIRTVAEGETVWDAFSMYRLADAITTGNFERQDDALSNTEWTDKPDYFDNTIDLLKSIDFSKVDIITIAYGTNDFTGENALDDSENPTNTKTYGGALRYSVETILSVFPHIRIFVLSPTYRFWLANGTFDVDSNTKTNGRNNTLIDFVEMAKKIANEYCVSFIDNYYELGFNKFNRTIYFPTTDGTHPNETGRKLIADHIVAKLF